MHRTPERTYGLASITVVDEPPEQSFADDFAQLRTHRDMAELREQIEPVLDSPPDKTLSFIAEMDMGVPEGVDVMYVCPMHPDVTSEEPGSCPKCGMKLLAGAAKRQLHVPDASRRVERRAGAMPEVRHEADAGALAAGSNTRTHEHHGHGEHEGTAPRSRTATRHDGIEWEDDMVEVNRMTTRRTCAGSSSIDTGAENHQIDWTFRVGDR